MRRERDPFPNRQGAPYRYIICSRSSARIERRIPNPQVAGSNPAGSIIKIKYLSWGVWLGFEM